MLFLGIFGYLVGIAPTYGILRFSNAPRHYRQDTLAVCALWPAGLVYVLSAGLLEAASALIGGVLRRW